LTWCDALAEMNSALDEIEYGLRSEWAEPLSPSSWTTPADLGVIPAELRDLARDHLRRITEVEVAIAERQHAVVAQLAREVRRDPRRADAPVSIIDWRV
jgi:hypothetical protein